jgi:hypothetical protein
MSALDTRYLCRLVGLRDAKAGEVSEQRQARRAGTERSLDLTTTAALIMGIFVL